MSWRLAGGVRLDELVRELEARGEAFAVATVVRRRPPASARPGDRAVITASGQVYGWVGGGCSRDLVVRVALEVVRTGRPRLLRLGSQSDDEDVIAAPMACPSEGELEVFIEPWFREPRLVVFGQSVAARTLEILGRTLGYEVTVVGPDEVTGLPEFGTARELYAVVATMGHYDEDALEAALRLPARYVALVASRRRAGAVMAELGRRGWSTADLSRIQAPAGLDLGAATQEEVALAVMAEITRLRRSGSRAEPLDLPAVLTARDPVCSMEVDITGARHRAEWSGQTYYFCCARCRRAFLDNPANYAGADRSGSPGASDPEAGGGRQGPGRPSPQG